MKKRVAYGILLVIFLLIALVGFIFVTKSPIIGFVLAGALTLLVGLWALKVIDEEG